jgi:hypothetical protein
MESRVDKKTALMLDMVDICVNSDMLLVLANYKIKPIKISKCKHSNSEYYVNYPLIKDVVDYFQNKKSLFIEIKEVKYGNWKKYYPIIYEKIDSDDDSQRKEYKYETEYQLTQEQAYLYAINLIIKDLNSDIDKQLIKMPKDENYIKIRSKQDFLWNYFYSCLVCHDF